MGLFHRCRGPVPHVRQHVGIGVEGDGYGCMSEHLRDDLRVHVAGEKQRCARVPQVVKTDLWEAGVLEQRLELECCDGAPVEGTSRFGREYEAVLAPQGADPINLP
jgi:hypothetical protein